MIFVPQNGVYGPRRVLGRKLQDLVFLGCFLVPNVYTLTPKQVV